MWNRKYLSPYNFPHTGQGLSGLIKIIRVDKT